VALYLLGGFVFTLVPRNLANCTSRFARRLYRLGVLMNRTVAKIIGIIASLGCLTVIPEIVSVKANADEDTQLFIQMLVTSFLAMCLGLYIESKKGKPNIQVIASLALLNFVGVGIAVYNILIDDDN
jgi:hypothetical protein